MRDALDVSFVNAINLLICRWVFSDLDNKAAMNCDHFEVFFNHKSDKILDSSGITVSSIKSEYFCRKWDREPIDEDLHFKCDFHDGVKEMTMKIKNNN